MAIGEWTDGRAFWFFQALVESAKLDAGMENQHNLLVQGPALSFPCGTNMIGEWTEGGGGNDTLNQVIPLDGEGALTLTGSMSYQQEVTFRLYDRCPWNRLVVEAYVKDITGAATLTFYRRPPATDRSLWTQLYQLVAGGFTADGWYGDAIDITGLSPDRLTLVLEADLNAGTVTFGSGYAQLASTVAGVS